MSDSRQPTERRVAERRKGLEQQIDNGTKFSITGLRFWDNHRLADRRGAIEPTSRLQTILREASDEYDRMEAARKDKYMRYAPAQPPAAPVSTGDGARENQCAICGKNCPDPATICFDCTKRENADDSELYEAYLFGCEDECLPEPLTKEAFLAKFQPCALMPGCEFRRGHETEHPCGKNGPIQPSNAEDFLVANLRGYRSDAHLIRTDGTKWSLAELLAAYAARLTAELERQLANVLDECAKLGLKYEPLIMTLTNERAESAERRVEELRQFVRHIPGCRAIGGSYPAVFISADTATCTCGLAALLAGEGE